MVIIKHGHHQAWSSSSMVIIKHGHRSVPTADASEDAWRTIVAHSA